MNDTECALEIRTRSTRWSDVVRRRIRGEFLISC